MEKYKNKYRIPSARLPDWDYGAAALYFITICTHNRVHFFGDIDQQNIQLSEIGKIAALEWAKTFALRPDMNLYQGEFVVMPNHFHGIIGIGENLYNLPRRRDAMHRVSTTPPTTNEPNETNETTINPKNKFGPQSKNMASIIRGFKSSVTMAARTIRPDFKWQARYHDHIIRNQDSFHRITNYIIQNPENWQADKFYRQ